MQPKRDHQRDIEVESKTLLAEKLCLVTGAGRCIGRTISLELARLGANFALCARTLAEVRRVAAEIEEIRPGASMTFTVDISDFDSVSTMVSEFVRRFGRVDVLVNNAGVQGPIGQLWSNDLQDWKRTVEINLYGTVHLLQGGDTSYDRGEEREDHNHFGFRGRGFPEV